MPTQYSLYGVEADGKTRGPHLFTCCVNSYGNPKYCGPCRPCEAKTKAGHTCKLTACRDTHYCTRHLKVRYNVVVAKSRIPNAGFGLFASTSTYPRGRTSRKLIFLSGTDILPYEGRLVDKRWVDQVYDYNRKNAAGVVEKVSVTAPYAMARDSDGKIIDAACSRGAAGYANDSYLHPERNNAEFTPKGYVRATKDIYEGDEILVTYGEEYWHSDGVHNLKTVNRCMSTSDATKARRKEENKSGKSRSKSSKSGKHNTSRNNSRRSKRTKSRKSQKKQLGYLSAVYTPTDVWV
jgi:hypothetical protein